MTYLSDNADSQNIIGTYYLIDDALGACIIGTGSLCDLRCQKGYFSGVKMSTHTHKHV